jgi:hypothetical protein
MWKRPHKPHPSACSVYSVCSVVSLPSLDFDANAITEHRLSVLGDGHDKAGGEGSGLLSRMLEVIISQSPPIGSLTITDTASSL